MSTPETLQQSAVAMRLSMMPEATKNQLENLAQITGETVEAIVSRGIHAGYDNSAMVEHYSQVVMGELASKPFGQLTEKQSNALVDILGAMIPDNKEARTTEEQEKRRLYLLSLLADIHADDVEKGRTPFSGMLGVYGGGGYVGGDKGSVPDFDRLRAYASKSSNTGRWMKELDELQALYEKPLVGSSGREKMGEFMRRFVGQSEWHGANQGPLVAMTMGAEGLPYCGGGMRMIVNRVLGADFYDAKDWRSAASALNVGRHFGAIKNGDPKPGDIVVFPGAGASGCHVGMISRVDEKGNAYYVDFNGGNSVKEAPLRGRTVVGLVDIEVLAQKKAGKTLEQLIDENDKRLSTPELVAGIKPDKPSQVAAVVTPPKLPDGVGQSQRKPVTALG